MAQRKYALIGKDLWDVIEDGGDFEEDKKVDRKAKSLEKHHLNTVEQAATAKGLWDTFTATYKANSNARKMSLRKEFSKTFGTYHKACRQSQDHLQRLGNCSS